MLKLLLAFLCLAAFSYAQNASSADYLAEPVLLWTVGIGQIQEGNGAFISPAGDLLAVVGSDATVRGINPLTGAEEWIYTPDNPQYSTSYSGAFFSQVGVIPYILYSIVTNAFDSTSVTSKIIALSPTDGSKLFETEDFAGIAKGTPVASADGSFIVTTHNANGTDGYFSVFNYGVSAANITYKNSSHPFSAVGYFYGPAEGNFPEGAGNTNDLFVFAADTPAGASAEGSGQLFAFQQPIPNPFNATPAEVVVVGDKTAFQTPNAPVLANKGYLMYISGTQSEIRYWSGSGLPRDYFSRGSKGSTGLERGSIRWAAAKASPTLNSDLTQPYIYGPSAANEVYRLSWNLSDSTIHTTSAPLTNKVLLTADDSYVYYAVDGVLTQLDATTLDVVWNVTIGTGSAGIKGEIALSPNGKYVYVPDSAGSLYSFQVLSNATVDPTVVPAPVAAVSDVPSLAPSGAPQPGTSPTSDETPTSPTSNETPTSVEKPSASSPEAAPVEPPSSDSVVYSSKSYFGMILAILMAMI